MSLETAEELKTNMSEGKAEDLVDWYEAGSYENRVVNFERAHAIVLDKPFDPKYRMYAFGTSALFKNEDGTFDEAYDVRCPNLSLNGISVLIENLYNNYQNSDKVRLLKSLDELDFDAKLFYDSEKTFESVKDCPKIIVTFENQEIKEILTYRLETNLKYTNTLITFNALLQQKRAELDRNILLQNLFGALTEMSNKAKGKTKSGIITG